MKTILSILIFCLTVNLSASAQNKEMIYAVVDQMPEYLGGDLAMWKYLYNVELPTIPDEAYQQSRVVLRFYIDKRGQVKDAKIIRSLHPIIDSVFLKAIKEMPKWKPSKKDGKVVSAYYWLPITLCFRK